MAMAGGGAEARGTGLFLVGAGGGVGSVGCPAAAVLVALQQASWRSHVHGGTAAAVLLPLLLLPTDTAADVHGGTAAGFHGGTAAGFRGGAAAGLHGGAAAGFPSHGGV